MNVIVNKILVKDFYRQNAGFFLFLFVFFFGVIAPSQQLAYHYSLILGMLETPVFLAIVMVAWLLYATKTARFVLATLAAPESAFLYRLASLPLIRLTRISWKIQALLLLPIWSYSLAVSGVAGYRGYKVTALGVQVYMILLCGLGAYRFRYQLLHPGGISAMAPRQKRRKPPYWSILVRHLLEDDKALLAGVKLFGCAILYLLLRQQDPADHDLRMIYLFYSLALLGHGVLLYRCRHLENTRLLFYRVLPVSLLRRFGQYTIFSFLLLLPETLVLCCWMTPEHLRLADTLTFITSGYSVILLMNCLLLVARFTNRDFEKCCLGIFGILYCCVLGNVLLEMSGSFVVTAAILFFRGYARNEMGT
jgi:hypothetical protein